MTKLVEDCAKRRLIDRRELEFAISFMHQRGVELDDVPVQLTRYYYVDIDEVNDILREMMNVQSAPAKIDREPAAQNFSKVA